MLMYDWVLLFANNHLNYEWCDTPGFVIIAIFTGFIVDLLFVILAGITWPIRVLLQFLLEPIDHIITKRRNKRKQLKEFRDNIHNSIDIQLH